MIRSAAFLFITALIVAALAGCGSDSNGSTGGSSSTGASAETEASTEAGTGTETEASAEPDTSTETDQGGDTSVEASSLSKAQYVKQADEICTRRSEFFLESINAYMKKHASDSSQSEAELTADAVRAVMLPKMQVENDEVRSLGAPAGEESQVEAYLSAMQETIDSLEKRQRVTLGQVSIAFEGPEKMAAEYGFESCP